MLRRLLAGILLAMLATTAIAYCAAIRTPRVIFHVVTVPDWPAGAPPMRLAFLSDTHVAGPDMPPARLARIVAQVNALRPDCVLLGGDYVSRKRTSTRFYSFAEAVAPFAGLRPRWVTLAVPGNHDLVRGSSAAMMATLARVGVVPLVNRAARCGPLTIAGSDELVGGHASPRDAAAAARELGGPRILIVHNPDLFLEPDARAFPVTIAGHTHCGQIALPWYGAIVGWSRLPHRMMCGRTDTTGGTLIVGAGLGTSALPLRLFTRPQILLIEVRGRAGRAGERHHPSATPLSALRDN